MNLQLYVVAAAFALLVVFYFHRSVRLLTGIRDELSKLNAKTTTIPK